MKNFEVKVDVQKGGPRIYREIDSGCAHSIQFMFHLLLSHCLNPRCLPCLFMLGFVNWVLGSIELEVHGVLISFVEFFSLDCG
jgi:hypothetical protein